jgi:hypothetical protein
MKHLTELPVKIQTLVNEYKADPNCWPELWICGENLTNDEKKQFIYACLQS